jgi:hypothetical protein
MSFMGALPENVECRDIEEADWDGVMDCLGRGFPTQPRHHWEQALRRMASRPAIEGCPRYGHALESEGRIVGVMLALYFRVAGEEGDAVRCNLSSWTVDEEHRSYAGKLVKTALRRKDVTYLSITPAPVTLKITEALKFQRFSNGQHAFVPALGGGFGRYRVVAARAGMPELDLLDEGERDLLLEHAALGCDALICIRDGAAYPFVFKTRRVLRGFVPCRQVIYCRSHAELSQCAGAIGRHLLWKGGIFALVDAMAPVPGLVGRYFAEVGPKYFRGPNPPKAGDLAFTEFVVLGS